MKRIIPCLYSEFGRYIDKFRSIPYKLDLLKPVERRLLIALFNIAKDHYVKSAKIIGEVIAKYHPHGDISTYGSLISLVQRNYAIGQGNWGLNLFEETEAAAYRYTKVKSNPAINKFAFEFIDFVTWDDPENLSELQPLYLPSPFPVGLIGSNIIQGITFHSTKIPRYSFTDLTTRLLGLLQKKKNPNFVVQTIIPKIPNCDIYEEHPGDFEKILTQGEGSIRIIPKFSIKSDGIYVYGQPPNGLTKIQNIIEENNDQIFKVIDLSSQIFEIVIIPVDKKNYNQTFIDTITDLLTTTLNFSCKVVDDNGVVFVESIDKLLLDCYENWSLIYETKLRYEKNEIEKKIKDLFIISLIKELLHKYKIQNIDNLLQLFLNDYGSQYPQITSDMVKSVCSKYKIQTLLDFNTNTKKYEDMVNEINNKLSNMQNSCFTKFQDIFNSTNEILEKC